MKKQAAATTSQKKVQDSSPDQKHDDSFSFPGSSGSWWFSSSTGTSGSSSAAGHSSAYSAGSSFYKEPNVWHQAGYMKTAFAYSCSTFTRLGAARFFGGYYKELYIPPNSTTHPPNHTTTTTTTAPATTIIAPQTEQAQEEDDREAFYQSSSSSSTPNKNKKSSIGEDKPTEVTVLSQRIFDLRFPTTDEIANISLPDALKNITGLTSCSASADTGNTFVMAGTGKEFSSSAVFMFSDNLAIQRDISLPFSVNRSAIAATIMYNPEMDEIHNFFSTDSSTSTFRPPTGLLLKDQSSLSSLTDSSSSSSSSSSNITNISTTLTTTTTATPSFIPDAVVIGGEDQPYLWGLDAVTGSWKNMCAFDRPLCDCVIISHPYEYFVMACTNCQTPQYAVLMANLSCSYWDSQAPAAFTGAEGLQYVQGISIGKFSTFAYRPVRDVLQVHLILFDHELEQWITFNPQELLPPRTSGALFSWLGRLQLAGGEPLGLFSTNQQQQSTNKSDDDLKHDTFYNIEIDKAISDLPIVQMNNVVDLDNNQQNQFFVGDVVEFECPENSFIVLATAPNCLHRLSNFSYAKCSRENLGSILLTNVVQEAYLCISPGTCKLGTSPKKCPGSSNHSDFSHCSGMLGCCWNQQLGTCYEYSSDTRYGAPYFYLISAKPVSVVYPTTLAPPPPTPSPGSNSNSTPSPTSNNGRTAPKDTSFLASTTGKIVVVGASCIIGITVIVATVMHCMNKNKEGGSAFCLHEFVSKRYDVIKELGRGGFGTVYLAVRKTDQMALALKVIACSNEDDVLCALQEFQLLRDIKPHPGMMRIIDIHLSWDEEEEKKKKEREQKKRERANAAAVAGSKPNSGLIPTSQSQNNSRSDDNDSPTGSPVKANPTRQSNGIEQTEPLLPSKSAASLTNITVGASSSDLQGAKIEQQKYVCIVMEYYDEGDLAQYIAHTFQKGGGPTETWLWTVLAKQLFGALAHLHAQQPHPIVHRDIKPENILLASHGNRVIITDFGLAASHERTFMSTRAGSFHYLAPECWSHRYTASVDVWSAGCILYAAATGCVAPPAARVMFNDARHPSFPNEIRDDLRSYSPEFANLVLSVLKMDPNARPTAQQLFDTISKKCEMIANKNYSDEDSKSNPGSVHMTNSSVSHSEKSNASVQW